MATMDIDATIGNSPLATLVDLESRVDTQVIEQIFEICFSGDDKMSFLKSFEGSDYHAVSELFNYIEILEQDCNGVFLRHALQRVSSGETREYILDALLDNGVNLDELTPAMDVDEKEQDGFDPKTNPWAFQARISDTKGGFNMSAIGFPTVYLELGEDLPQQLQNNVLDVRLRIANGTILDGLAKAEGRNVLEFMPVPVRYLTDRVHFHEEVVVTVLQSKRPVFSLAQDVSREAHLVELRKLITNDYQMKLPSCEIFSVS